MASPNDGDTIADILSRVIEWTANKEFGKVSRFAVRCRNVELAESLMKLIKKNGGAFDWGEAYEMGRLEANADTYYELFVRHFDEKYYMGDWEDVLYYAKRDGASNKVIKKLYERAMKEDGPLEAYGWNDETDTLVEN